MKCRNCKNEAREGYQFCSKSCRYSYFTGDRNPAKRESVRKKLRAKALIRELDPEYSKKLWQRNKYGWIKIICLNCKKQRECRRSNVKLFCSTKCSELFHCGKNHPLWTGLDVDSYGENWSSQKRLARERDNNTCQICGKSRRENGAELDVHHMIPFKIFKSYKDANRLENLICLCIRCHRKQLRKLSWFRDNVIVRTALGNAEIDRKTRSQLLRVD